MLERYPHRQLLRQPRCLTPPPSAGNPARPRVPKGVFSIAIEEAPMDQWFVVRSRVQHEFAAEEDLRELDGYCPKCLVRRRPRKMHGMTLIRSVPRFATYLFVGGADLAAAAGLIRSARRALGLGFVRFGDQVAKVDDATVAALKAA